MHPWGPGLECDAGTVVVAWPPPPPPPPKHTHCCRSDVARDDCSQHVAMWLDVLQLWPRLTLLSTNGAVCVAQWHAVFSRTDVQERYINRTQITPGVQEHACSS